MNARLFATTWLVFAAALAVGSAAAARERTASKTPARRWQIAESENLRILSYSSQPIRTNVIQECEAIRAELCEKWLTTPLTAWKPKCDVVLHHSSADYLAAVGAGAGSTVASSLVTQGRGGVSARRIDVLATRADWVRSALPHELAHVLIADVLPGGRVPRWLDEGLAILVDPAEKQALHRRDFETALAGRTAFRLVELLSLNEYPAAARWGTFYGQSASLVDFLTHRDGPSRLIEFASAAQRIGYEAALAELYQIHGVAELERQWLAEAKPGKSGPPLSGNSTLEASAKRTAGAPARPAIRSIAYPSAGLLISR